MGNDNFPLSPGDIVAEYNEEVQTIINIIIDFTSGITLLTSLFIIYLIFYRSPKVMSEYKKFLLVNILLEMVNVTIVALGKPRSLYGRFIAFSAGLLPIENGMFTNLSHVLWNNGLLWSATSLVLLQVERYYAINKGLIRKSFPNVRFFIYFYLILNILIALTLVSAGIFGDVFIHGDIVTDYIMKLSGGKEFLQKHPGAVLLNNRYTVWIVIYYISITIASICVLVPLFTFLFLNAYTVFRGIHSKVYNQKTKNMHMSLVKASILQVVLLLIFGAIPIIFILIALVMNHMLLGMGLMQCILNFYPLSDNIIIFFFIKPYRNFVFHFWKKFSNERSIQHNLAENGA